MRKTVQVLSLLWSVTLVLGQTVGNPFPLDQLAQFVQNYTNFTTAKYKSSQVYSLVFTLDGKSGDGLFEEPAQVREFTAYMINLTSTFNVNPADLLNVTTRCRYRSQNSYDGDIMLSIASTGTTKQQMESKQMVGDDDELDDETLDQMLEQTLQNSNTTYKYEFSMNYSSNVIDVTNYTKYFEDTMARTKIQMARTLRRILMVEATKTLTVYGTFVSWDDLLMAAMKEELGTNTTLPPGNIIINITLGGNPASTQTPSISSQPSSIPSISPAPTLTRYPTNLPSIMPTNYPTTFPSASPTMFPTFFVNSTSRGRYELTFTVTGNRAPETDRKSVV